MDDEKKTERKKRRYTARLQSSKGIICTDVVGPNIILCNAGQATGLNKNIVLKLISELPNNIEIPKLIAEKGETYSFLVFSSTESSSLFYDTYNGKSRIDNKTPLYLSYVETVPNTDIICYHESPKGLLLLDDFITPVEEQELIELFDWIEDNESNNLKNRQVKHYGYEFQYGSNDVDLNAPLSEKIPNECDVLWRRLRTQYGLHLGEPDQLTVNKYAPGHGIPNHVDKHSPFGDTILSLSLGSSVVMDWKHHSNKNVPVLVRARSMLVMRGEARYDWQHGIQSRTWDPVIELRTIVSKDGGEEIVKVITSDTVDRLTRISLTFRWTRKGPCECCFKTLCDSVVRSPNIIEDEVASNLEELHVHQVYEQIASHFSSTRHTPWPRVVQFMRRVCAGAVVVDLGCGNGKNILRRNDILQIAGERSSGLLRECKTHVAGVDGSLGAECVRLDVTRAGLRDACADAVLCVAVVHHCSTEARRLQAIATISRILRPGGRALITVWAKDQSASNYLCRTKAREPTEQRVTVGGLHLPVHENRTQFQHNDVLVPWKLRRVTQNKTLSPQPEDTLLRYYHVFEEGELERLCRRLPLEVEESFYEEGNWCVICKKINVSS